MAAAISKSVLDFLRDLEANNEREWFQANRDRYEREFLAPVFAFIEAMAEPIARLSPELAAIPAVRGGSLFRIHRDVRFAKDKSPFKTHAGMHFFHRQTSRKTGPGVYVHVQPGESFAALGLHCTNSGEILPVRQAIVERPDDWAAVRGSLAAGGLELGGESLKGAPRGFSKDHPHIADLKRKHAYVSTLLSDDMVLQPDFGERVLERLAPAAPLGGFIARAMELPW
jgi:uncharacterized protein (TIGR02453 family)